MKCGTPAGSAQAPGSRPPHAPTVSPAGYPSAAPGAAAPVAKKRGPLFWILGGCLGLILIAAIIAVSAGYFVYYKAKQAGFDPELMRTNPGLAVAKILATIHPDIEVLSIDENRGLIKVRDKKTGQTLTMDMADIKSGKIVFRDDQNQVVELQARGEGDKASLEIKGPEGSLSIGAGAVQLPSWLPTYPGAEGAGTFGVTTKEGKGGSYAFTSKDAPEDVASFYEDALKGEGFEVQRNDSQVAGQGSLIVLAAKDENSQRSAQVTVSGKQGTTTVNLVFEDKK
jgi:hypothetical protein